MKLASTSLPHDAHCMSLTRAIARLIQGRREQKYRIEELEMEVSAITLISGPAPSGMEVKSLGLIKVIDGWTPDAARRLIKHQAMKRGANCIIRYREEPFSESGEIRCSGEAIRVSRSDRK